MLKTKDQSKVSISGLTYNNLLEDAYNALRDSDAFKNNFTDFTSNTAERMIVELYAYVATQLANRLDQMGNELFVDTASASGMSRLLKLVGAKVDFPSAASVDATVSTSTVTGPILLTSGIGNAQDGNDLNYSDGNFKSVAANNGTNWEFIDYKVGNDGRFVYDYTTRYTFEYPSKLFKIHEGKTHAVDYTIRSINTDIITLSDSPVLKDSVRIYYKQKSLKAGTTNAYEIKEFKKVDNFFTTEALTADTGIFTERNMGNGKCEICLKPYYNEELDLTDLGKELLIMYRTGSGADGNISIGAIDKTEGFQTTNATNRTTGDGTFTIYNISTGVGGKDELTTNEIRATVMQEVRNTKIAVSEEDYEYMLPKYDSGIELIKCYGEKNEDSADLAETYGYYVNPLYVWLIILKYNKEFYDAYMSDIAELTNRINDISFSTLDINPRFNEKYQINSASLNQLYLASELPSLLTESSNTYSLPINADGLKTLAGKSCKITVTNYPYIESSDPDRRGENCFRRYSALTSPELVTWTELMGLTSANVGDVHIVIRDEDEESVTKTDPLDGVNYRWKCIQSFSEAINPAEYTKYWERVDFSYIYDNLVSSDISEDRLFITQSAEDVKSFSPVYSSISDSFKGDWDVLLDNWPGETGGIETPATYYMNVNGVAIEIPNGSNFLTPQELCGYLNTKMMPTTFMVILKENVVGLDSTAPTSVTIEHKEGYTGGNSHMVIRTIEQSYTVTLEDASSATTYGQLVELINTSLANANIGDKYKAVLYRAVDCWNLALISPNDFSYQDLSTDDTSSFYVYLLNNSEPSTWPIEADETEVPAGVVEEWSGFLNPAADGLFYVGSDGQIHVGFGADGECTLQILSNDGSVSVLREAFGLSSTNSDVNIIYARRIVTVDYVDENNAYVRIIMTGPEDRLNSNIYINIFGDTKGTIKLGEYYENIEENLPNVPSVVRDLLKRDAITHLYSTNYISEGDVNVEDKYGSNYQLKFSTGLVGEQTFNQLSSGNSPAEFTTTKIATDTMPYYEAKSYLYMKIDNMDYAGTTRITVNRENYIVPEVNGYARFDLSWFNSSTIITFIEQLVQTFYTNGFDNTPQIKYVPTEDNKLKVYTTSSAYYSSIDFGSTNQNTLFTLFGLDDIVVKSPEGQINLKQIEYKILSLTNALAVGRSITIKCIPSESATPVEAVVLIGYSLSEFANNIANSKIGKYVVLDNNRIIFKELTNGAKVTYSLTWENELQHDTFEGMFVKESWDEFEIVSVEPEKTTAECTFTNEGDYYIRVETVVDEDDNTKSHNEYYFVTQTPASFPYGDIYFHMYEDYSNDHIVKTNGDDVVYTDEYNWNNLMTEKKVMLTEHVYKQPRFIPFDLAITCYLPNTEQYSQTDYNTEIANYLREEYGLYSDNIGEEILSDDIILNIKENFSKVQKVNVDYLGYNILNSTTNQESLATQFNQKHILASTETSVETVTDETSKLISVKEVIKHGLKITLKYRP